MKQKERCILCVWACLLLQGLLNLGRICETAKPMSLISYSWSIFGFNHGHGRKSCFT